MARIFFLLMILVILLGLLPNYSTQPIKENYVLNNGCLIYAIQYQYALEAKNILNESNVWVKIILYKVKGAKSGHAVTLYIYRNSTYIYDPAITSYQLAEYPIYDPYKIAQWMNPLSKIEWAEYAESVMLYNP